MIYFKESAYAILVILIGTLSGRLFPIRSNLPNTPPGWVFGVVWPILYGIFGVLLARSSSLTFTILLATLLTATLTWPYLYSIDWYPKEVIEALCLAAIVLILVYKEPLLIPYAIWLMYASTILP